MLNLLSWGGIKKNIHLKLKILQSLINSCKNLDFKAHSLLYSKPVLILTLYSYWYRYLERYNWNIVESGIKPTNQPDI
jgi:hypothetical protein